MHSNEDSMQPKININKLIKKKKKLMGKDVKKKWIKDLNVRPDTIKLLEENIGRTLLDINHSKIFFDPPTRVMEIKTK